MHSILYKIWLKIILSIFVDFPMGTSCAHIVAVLFLFCYERDFMLYLSDNNQAVVIEGFNSMSRYLDDWLNTYNPYFEQMVYQINPTELQLNNSNSSDTKSPILGKEEYR